ncbi:alpha/beta hydrolase [Microbulbifer flavimaris]|uniref:Alpha/beta hydrolase n=1 Tax=Microbulbifer flavimaris TaxID=1781068 RepID=A0ABX4I340_9GAMM|nr:MULTISPECIES: alpha/beta fold hydrolase [Microbulbifer]KUJ84389.1 acetyltransferase [Microbulbifer sp. ZGT114]PCO06473.1 alpha/beta hydrolase [Microbulbifer flavimaris]
MRTFITAVFGLTLLLPPVAQGSCAILLHGLGRSDGSMESLERALEKADFQVVNVDYPSTVYPIETLAGQAIAPALDRCGPGTPVHFVTHSMGGILVRHYLSRVPVPNLGRVVMLGPPNKGSEVVDALGEVPGFHAILGDAGLQLGTSAESVPNQLGAANFEVGIIAGTRSINPVLSQIIPATDDGKVSVASTRLDGMSDHLQMPVTHVFMMQNDEVIKQVIYFLQHGRFYRPGPPSS